MSPAKPHWRHVAGTILRVCKAITAGLGALIVTSGIGWQLLDLVFVSEAEAKAAHEKRAKADAEERVSVAAEIKALGETFRYEMGQLREDIREVRSARRRPAVVTDE